ncbi:methyltransferase [Raphidiopsis sp. BLCC-F218]
MQIISEKTDSNKSGPSQDEGFSAKEFFNRQWELYQKVLNNNYMGHQEIYDVLHKLLAQWSKPFTMLDLGCGDASFTSRALLNTQITEYTGVDVSTAALVDAEQNIALIGCGRKLVSADCWQFTNDLVQCGTQKFDVVLISFALHHLQPEEKERVINNIRTLLNPHGIFILIDIIRQEKEDRESYIQRYLRNVKRDWSLIDPQEYTMVENHISSSDFPETQSWFQTSSQKLGFINFTQVYCDDLDTTQLLCFYR